MNKKKKKFKLGPLQKLWLSQLEKYPDRQMDHVLGEGSPRNYKACCLGELHLCAFRLAKKKLPFENGKITCNDHTGTLRDSYMKYGLRDESGKLEKVGRVRNINFSFLDLANDSGVTWTEIADYIRKNPENVFTKSV